MNRQCINCSHFCYWDEDWCCAAHMSIISPIMDNRTLNPEECEKDRSDCPDWNEDATNIKEQYLLLSQPIENIIWQDLIEKSRILNIDYERKYWQSISQEEIR